MSTNYRSFYEKKFFNFFFNLWKSEIYKFLEILIESEKMFSNIHKNLIQYIKYINK